MNICILIVDCLRADHLGCYGYQKNTSPNIDAIASQSIQFENAYSQSNWTAPSFYSMIAGRYPPTLMINWMDQKINSDFVVLPEYLAEKGYHTGIFTPFKMLLNPNAFSSHFNVVKELSLSDNILPEFRDWVKKDKNSFLFFHTAEFVHEPYFADQQNVQMFLDKSISVPGNSEIVKALTSKQTDKMSIMDVSRKINKRLKFPSKNEIAYLLACYDAGIYQVDKIVGDIHKALQEESEDYLFMLIADHGQAFMEHNYIGHGTGLHNEVLHVPLIVDYNNSGRSKVSETVQLMDIFPTIMELLGYEADFKLDGQSFASALKGGKLNDDRIAFADGSPGICVIKNNHKLISTYLKHMDFKTYLGLVKSNHGIRIRDRMSLITQFFREKLFDLRKDSAETKNISRQEKKIHKQLRAEIKNILDEVLSDVRPSVDAPLDDAIKKQLEALGYL